MATIIDYRTLNEIVSKHDRHYQWPKSTCLHPALELLRYVHGKDVPIDPILGGTEEDAGQTIIRIYGCSWFKFVEHYLIKNDYGHTIPTKDLQTGDIVEFSSDRIKAVGPWGDLIRNPVCLVADKDTLFLRGFGGITPLPIRFVRIVNAARIKGVIA